MSDPLLFVNLPVASVAKTKTFFSALGFTFNDQFSDETTICMRVSDQAYFMFLEHDRFKGFAPSGNIADTSNAQAVLLTYSADSRDDVDRIYEAAIAAGGTKAEDPQDHGFMYSQAFFDLDGQGWSVMWMDPAVAAGEAPPEHVAAA